jgi:2-polyprenyl-3-methyl-5-hydroxy-6-metoxy-1,4-benzoquinol methylase
MPVERTSGASGVGPAYAADARRSDAERPGVGAETPCPLCGRREYRVVSQIDRRGAPLRTVMCNLCGLVWTNPRPADADVDRYYATEYRLDYSRARTPTRRKLLRGFLGAVERRDWLAPYLTPGGRYLDVGCGAGEFVFVLRHRGVDAAGIEPGEEYAAFCRDVLKISIQTATVERARVQPQSQSIVTMFHMLEHVADPRRTLATIRDWLVPQSGRLIVEVPNVLSVVQAPRQRFHYAHLYNYSVATLAAFGDTAGLRLVSSRESEDGGNIVCVFGTQEAAAAPGAVTLPDNVAQTEAVLRGHRTVRHYLRATPYRRAWQKLRRRRREDRLLAQFSTIEALLDWARTL